jgi:hypothetical protein
MAILVLRVHMEDHLAELVVLPVLAPHLVADVIVRRLVTSLVVDTADADARRVEVADREVGPAVVGRQGDAVLIRAASRRAVGEPHEDLAAGMAQHAAVESRGLVHIRSRPLEDGRQVPTVVKHHPVLAFRDDFDTGSSHVHLLMKPESKG